MKTKCPKCAKEFELSFSTVYIGTEKDAPHEDIPVIKCPHCGHREEM